VLKRFDVFLAVAMVGAVWAWGDASTRLVDVFGLLSLWFVYFSGAIGMWFISRRQLLPVRAN